MTRLDRFRHVGFAAWAFLLALPAFVKSRSVPDDDWALLRSAGRMLAGMVPAVPPLHVYAAHADVQVGPPALALDAAAQRWLGGDLVLLVAIAALAGMSVWALELLGADGRGLLVAGLALATVWATLGGWGHIEDAMAVTAILCAAVALSRNRAVATGALLGLAVACKPWALVAAPMLLGLPWRTWWRAVLPLVAVAVLPWVPFVVADARTWDVTRYSWPIANGSALHSLGFAGATASWLRPVQIGVGMLACAAVAWRRWMWAPMAGIAVKVLLDPQVWAYYGLVPVAGALLIDVDRASPVPWWTLSAVGAMFIAPAVLPATASGYVRAAWAAGVLVAIAVQLMRRGSNGASTSTAARAHWRTPNRVGAA